MKSTYNGTQTSTYSSNHQLHEKKQNHNIIYPPNKVQTNPHTNKQLVRTINRKYASHRLPANLHEVPPLVRVVERYCKVQSVLLRNFKRSAFY